MPFPCYTGILRILPGPQLITINQSEGSNTWTGALSSPVAFGGKPAWDKRAFPETPVTPSATLVSAVRPSLRDKSVPEVKKRKESEGGGGEKSGGCSCYFITPLSPLPPVALFLRLAGAANWQVTAEQSNNAIPLACIANNAGDLINGQEEKQGQINRSLAALLPCFEGESGPCYINWTNWGAC